jgi:hypothetical protein
MHKIFAHKYLKVEKQVLHEVHKTYAGKIIMPF